VEHVQPDGIHRVWWPLCSRPGTEPEALSKRRKSEPRVTTHTLTGAKVEAETYETRDLALATYLQTTCPGGSIRRYEWKASHCVFVFLLSEALMEAIETYNSGNATVEPRQFVIESSKIKKEMFRAQRSADSPRT
jgi:hypothetical protein